MSSNHNFPLFVIGTHWLTHFLYPQRGKGKKQKQIFVNYTKTKITGSFKPWGGR